jgi:hypothetical protein
MKSRSKRDALHFSSAASKIVLYHENVHNIGRNHGNVEIHGKSAVRPTLICKSNAHISNKIIRKLVQS